MKAFLLIAGIAGVLVLASFMQAEPIAYTKPPETSRLLPGTNVVKAVSYCSMCHSSDYISTQPPLAHAAWKGIVVKMQKVHGAPIPEAEIDPIVEYLVTTYGTEKKTTAAPAK